MSTQHLYRFICMIALLLGLALWGKFAVFYSQAGSDFIQDYYAAQALRAGLPIYQGSVPLLAKAVMPNDSFENYHPPFNALMYLPLTFFSFEAAFRIWSAISLGLYVLMIYLLSRKGQRTLLFAFGLMWYPFIYGIGTGQSSILIAALITAGWLALNRGSRNLAGILLAIPCMIKLFPLILGGFLLFTKRWHVLFVWCASIGMLVALTSTVVGLGDMLVYAKHVAAEDVQQFGAIPLNVSVTGVLLPLLAKNGWTAPLLFMPIEQAALITNLLSAALVLAALMLAFRLVSQNQESEAFSLLLVAMVLCSPISWMHIFPVLFIPLATVWQKVRASNRLASRELFLLSLLLLSLPDVYLIRTIAPCFQGEGFPLGVFLLLKSPTLGLVLLGILLFFAGEKEANQELGMVA